MKKLLLIFAVVIIVILAIAAYIFITKPPPEMSNAQKEQAIANILGRKPNLTDETPKGDVSYNGKYASFLYHAAGTIYKYQDPGLKQNSSVLETFSFDIKDPRLVFNYAVFDTPSFQTISDNADVKFRQLPQEGYIQSDLSADGQKGLSFERGGETVEKSGFFLINGKSYSISVTGSSQKDVESLFNQIAGSLKFNL